MIIDTARSVYEFFVSSGKTYSSRDQSKLQEAVAFAVLARQCLWKPGEYAVIYWMIWPEDVQAVVNRKLPRSYTEGPILYVAECACKTKDGMAEIRKELRKLPAQGTFWHSTKRGIVKMFPRQKGAYHGIRVQQ